MKTTDKYFTITTTVNKNDVDIKKNKLVMTLCVRNEEDIIRHNIDFHLTKGVDFIIATDNGSTDGTLNILKEYEQKGVLRLIEEPQHNHDQAAWNNRMAEIAKEKYNADIIFHCDADEFWFPRSGNLKDEISNRPEDILNVDVINILLADKDGNESFPQNTRFAVVKPIIARDYIEETKHINFFYFKYPSKVIFKTNKKLLFVSEGNHFIINNDDSISEGQSQDVIIYHYPIRSKASFLQKTVMGGRAYELNDVQPKEASFHVRRWYASYKRGLLEEEYKKLILHKGDVDKLMTEGFIEEVDFNNVILGHENKDNSWRYFNRKFEYEDMFHDFNWPWAGHKRFAYDLVRNNMPQTIVELGTHKGTSFFSFCQAVNDAHYDAQLYAIDTWKGDEHAGFYGDDVFVEFQEMKEKYYGSLKIKLLRKTFDEAAADFKNDAIDLLHIDGLHTYEAVKHDFESWFPKVRKDGIILLHDIFITRDNFGIYKLWEELKRKYETIEFYHSYGLGVLFKNATRYRSFIDKERQWQIRYSYIAEDKKNGEIGNSLANFGDSLSSRDNQIATLTKQVDDSKEIIRDRDAQIVAFNGQLSEARATVESRNQQIATLHKVISERDKQISSRDQSVQSLTQALAERDGHIANLGKTVTQRDAQIAELTGQLSEVRAAVDSQKQQMADLQQVISERDEQIVDLNRSLVENAEQITELNQAVAERDVSVANLIAERAHILSSTSWKITRPLRFIRSNFINNPYFLFRKLISDSVRKIWITLPLSAHRKISLKNNAFKYLPFLFRWTKAYRDWVAMTGNVLDASETIKEPLDFDSVEQPRTAYVPLLQVHPPQDVPVRLIAFYLPQFHTIPENDEWWGKGFTEWTNVKPAKPQFKGHYQPRIPGELGYYNLLDPFVQRRQVELAKLYGIGGFCFHFYWFAGKRLLEAPIENYFNDKSLDLPFCLCWANENWTRRWDGREKDILIAQKHSPEDDLAFIKHVARYMCDSRYIRIDGKPLLVLYRPGLLPSAKDTSKRWRKWCKENGIGEIYLAGTESFESVNPAQYGFDATIEFPPNNSSPPDITDRFTRIKYGFDGVIFDWRMFVQRSEKYEYKGYKLFRGVCPGWDNTPRRKNESGIFTNNSSDGFEKWIYNAAIDTIKRYNNPDERLVFINAWNEWAEGAYLEPDEKYGYAYLQSIYNALKKLTIQKTKPKILVVTNNIPRPDRSSGELRFASILEILSEFWEIDFCVVPSHVDYNTSNELIPFIKKLTDIGINVLPLKKEAFKKAIEENVYSGSYFNMFWIAEEVMSLFKIAQPRAFTIVDSVDVHYAREETQAKLGEIKQSQVAETKKRELSVYKAADVTIAVSKDDYHLLTDIEGVKNVFLIPNIAKVYPRATGKRKPIVIFIGSYTWYPNPDAVKWFASRIWPSIKKVISNAEFLIIGSDPTDEVKALGKIPGIKVVGYVIETKPYYEMAAVAVAPMRFGGGMKGKVNEAMAHGVPVVATKIGAQGFDAVHGTHMMICDDADEFADCVIRLLQDDILQHDMGIAGQELNSAICSHEAVKEKLEELIRFCEKLVHEETPPTKAEHMKDERNNHNIVKPSGIIEFPKIAEAPLVSIIIPVYNQWEYTFACLESILKNSGNVLFEIILADDNSTDDTRFIEKYVRNIRVIKNTTNTGFLFNCNNAAKFAKGKYVLFLNNDTLVQPGWLFWLVKTMEERPDVGMVGAKLVFSTGKLQEAGGVVFRDGSAMNYGREDDPDKPQYNYLKDIDYCSGACICVRYDIWKKLDGFDPQFAPAYYEDTDLAMRIRSLGYRTVYQPKSIVIHFDGISHGTDITKGIKKKQADNQKIFYSKWAVELYKNNYDRDENLFKARDRSKHKQTVLIINRSVPSASDHNEKTAQMINHFRDLNFNIKFLPNNFLRPAHDSIELEQAGVEILYGEYYRENWLLWIRENAGNIDLICFVDESLANKYLPILKSTLKGGFSHIIYDQKIKRTHSRHDYPARTSGHMGKKNERNNRRK